MSEHDRPSRRTFLKSALATGAAVAALDPFTRAFAAYPDHNLSVVIPTREGGGADRLARTFTEIWRKSLGVPFEFEFYPGAAGQVGYELFIHKKPHDGYTLLFGNMGPEMIMYALQKPNYKFPGDFVYFCRVDVDESVVYVSAKSPFKKLEDLVAEAKKRTVNVAVSRLPHPASIGMLALGEATGAKFNLVPYGGGNPTMTAVISGEVDCGALPGANPAAMKDEVNILGVFSDENKLSHLLDNAPSVNAVFGTKLPDLSSSRAWAVHAEVVEKMPDRFAKLESSAREVFKDPQYKDVYAKTGAPWEMIQYGNRDVCTKYALAMVEMAEKYRPLLTAKKKKG